jgi:hypothetical protein
MDARLEERHEGTARLFEGLSWQRHECLDERLQALEGFGNSLVVG